MLRIQGALTVAQPMKTPHDRGHSVDGGMKLAGRWPTGLLPLLDPTVEGTGPGDLFQEQERLERAVADALAEGDGARDGETDPPKRDQVSPLPGAGGLSPEGVTKTPDAMVLLTLQKNSSAGCPREDETSDTAPTAPSAVRLLHVRKIRPPKGVEVGPAPSAQCLHPDLVIDPVHAHRRV